MDFVCFWGHLCLTNTPLLLQKYKQQAMDYFIDKLKSSSDEMEIQGMLTGVRGMVSVFGPEIAKPHEKLFQKYKKEGTAMYIKDTATGLLNDMAGRRYFTCFWLNSYHLMTKVQDMFVLEWFAGINYVILLSPIEFNDNTVAKQ